ncbi:MAG: hypothetical protein IT580_18245, partial [Verrucomicrobiales bacterium]|nr:hypothetical protein [Verrucomicrobiales bacterium]
LAPLDRAAQAAFSAALGPELRVVPIRNGQCQRQHGGIHCATSVYPVVRTPVPPAPASPAN